MKLLMENWRKYLKEAIGDKPGTVVPITANRMFDELKLYAGKKWIFFDTETQGFSASSFQLTEIGAISVDTGIEIEGDEMVWKNPPKVVSQFNEKATLDNRSIGSMSAYYCLASNLDDGVAPVDTARENDVMSTLSAILKNEKVDCSQYKPFSIIGYEKKGKRESPMVVYRDDPEREDESLADVRGAVKAGRERGFVASMTNYLGNEDVKRSDEQTMLKNFMKFLDDEGGPEGVVLIIHNAKFDMKMISRRFLTDPETGKAPHKGVKWWKGKVFDTVTLFQRYFIPLLKTTQDKELMDKIKKGKFLSVSQGILATAFEVNAEHWHTAIADVEMLMGVLYEVSKYVQEHGDVDIRKAYTQAYPKPKRKRRR